MFYHQNSAVLTLLSCVVICLHLVANVSKEKLARIYCKVVEWIYETLGLESSLLEKSLERKITNDSKERWMLCLPVIGSSGRFDLPINEKIYLTFSSLSLGLASLSQSSRLFFHSVSNRRKDSLNAAGTTEINIWNAQILSSLWSREYINNTIRRLRVT